MRRKKKTPHYSKTANKYYLYKCNYNKRTMKHIALITLCMAFCGFLSAQEPVVEQMTKADFLQKVMNYEQNPTQWVYLGNKPCIIDFYADWCRPCKIASPILEELAQEYKGRINFFKVNTDMEKSLAGAFGIQSIPAFLYCPQNGKPQMSAVIAQSAEETKALFKKIIEEFLLKQ